MSQSKEIPREIALIGLVMLLLTVLGYVAVGVVLKMNGYPDNPMVRWTPLAVSLRQHGYWLLFVPLIWAIYAIIASRIDRGIMSFGLAFATGAILICVILLLFLLALFNPFTRPLLIFHTQPQKSSGTAPDSTDAPAHPTLQ